MSHVGGSTENHRRAGYAVLLRPGPHRYRRSMPSNSRRRGRSRQHLQTHQVEALAKQADERDRRADERDRRWFMRNVIASGIISTIVSTITGWLFWRLPRPQPQGRDVRISGGTDHGVRGGGTPRITPPQVVSLSAVIIDGGGSVSATLTQTPVESKTATRV